MVDIDSPCDMFQKMLAILVSLYYQVEEQAEWNANP